MNKYIATPCLMIMIVMGFAPLHAQSLHPAGLLFEDVTKASVFRKAVPQPTVRMLPSAVDNSAHMPPVGDQGSQNSCVAWAVGYYYKTYQEWQDYGWSVTDPNHIFSPSFIYNHINGGMDNGALFSDAMKMLKDYGCAPISRFPFVSDIAALPSQSVYRNALQYRSLDAYYIQTKTLAGINDVRNHIAAGNVAILGISIFGNFDNIGAYDNTYCVANKTGTNRGGHALVIVGYDDNKVTADGIGAFRLVNSWGGSFGDKGFLWMSYQAVMNAELSSQCVWYVTDRKHYAPSVIASLGIAHANMNLLALTIGIGPTGAPKYSKQMFDFIGNQSPNLPPRAFPSSVVDIDLSDGLQYLDTVQSNIIFLYAQSPAEGTVNSFSVTDLRSLSMTASNETPRVISDAGIYTTMNLKLVPGTTAALALSLRTGWNMISVPIKLSEMTVGALFEKATSPVYGYTDKYAVTTALQNGKGYWVRYPIDTTISLSGNRVAQTTIPLSAGWNLVGAFDQTISLALSTSAPPGIVQSPAYGMTDKYETTTIMEAGKSYWLKASEAGVLNLEAIVSASSMARTADRVVRADQKQIIPVGRTLTIRDRSGRTAFLYQRAGAVLGGDDELPPLPPDGIFDVRWETNRSVESADGDAVLLLHSLDYPLSISVEGGEVRICSQNVSPGIDAVLHDKGSLTVSNPGITRLCVLPVKTTLVAEAEQKPAVFELTSIYPNPFNPSATIRYSLSEDGYVTLAMYDVLGRLSASILSRQERAGRHSIVVNARDLSSGMYLCRLTAQGKRSIYADTRRVIVLK